MRGTDKKPRKRRTGVRYKTSWSDEEITFLRENYLEMVQEDIGKFIGRTRKAVGAEVKKLGLKKPRSLWVQQSYQRHPELHKTRFSKGRKVMDKEEMKRIGKLSLGVPKPNGSKTHKQMYEDGRWRPPIFDHPQSFSDTKPELAVKAKLDELGVRYQHPYLLNDKFLVDFYIMDFNTIIEVDGCYWHGCKECGHPERKSDKPRNAYILACGYRLEIVKEHELKR